MDKKADIMISIKQNYLVSLFTCLLLFSGFAMPVAACPPPPPPLPTAILEAVPEYVILGDSVTLDGSASYPGIVEYKWDFTNDYYYDYGETSGDHSDGAFDGKTTHTYSTADTYTAKLRVKRGDNGETDTDTCTFNVSDDVDEDDLPDDWEVLYFGDYTTYGAEDNPDGDGSKNLREYLHGTNPDDDGDEPTTAITIYVPYNARTIQRAINVCITDDTVEVEPGTYEENLAFTDKEITLTSTDPDNRAVVDATIIDGGGSGRVVTFGWGDADSTITGFTITNGYTSSSGGGGIYCYDVSPTISNCVITKNQSYNVDGGGIYCKGTDELTATPTISCCTISENEAYIGDSEGGGIYIDVYTYLTIEECIIEKNKASYHGGGISSVSAAAITHCVFSLNEAAAGGGIYLDDYWSGETIGDGYLAIKNCIFVNNQSSFSGGCILQGQGCNGNGIHDGTNLYLTNCIFGYNKASWHGGGVYNESLSDGTTKLTNCTFTGNYTTSSGGTGGGMFNKNSYADPILINCIFWENEADYGSTAQQQVYLPPGSDATVSYSCIEGWSGGTGNTSADPKFVSTSYPAGPDRLFGTRDDGLFPATDSPCIDKGYDSAPYLQDPDIIGNARITDGDHDEEEGVSATVDMGAYEVPRIWYVDYEKDGDGTSWSSAREYLQDALTIDAEGEDEIWVAAGTYYPDEGYGRTNNLRSEKFELIENVCVYGGFYGDETCALRQARCAANQTILSGDLYYDDEPEFTYRTDNSYHVVIGADGAVLDGFTIRGGNANGSGDDADGGGIYCDSVSFTLGNCAIVDNEATGYGGGMYCEDSSVEVGSCVFADNKGYAGAGVFNFRYGESGESWPVFSSCVFSKNEASNIGGGLFFLSLYPISAELANCTFYGNDAYQGGGMVNILCNMPVTNCIFWGNTADVSSSSQIDTSYDDEDWKPTFSHCDIYDCGGSGEGWDSDLGGDGGNNIEADPEFDIDEYGPVGEDGIWVNDDDGLRLDYDSPCINAARFWHWDTLFWLDITGTARTNYSPYPDIGAYESSYKIILAMCFIDETLNESYYSDSGKYETDMDGFETLLAGLQYYTTGYSIVKAGCIVPPYEETGYEGNLADVLPEGFFDPYEPPEIVEPGDAPVGISIAECDREPDGDELVEHFHRIREGVVPDCIVRLADSTSPLGGFNGLGDGYDDFVEWLEDWLEDNGLDPTDTSILPNEVEFGEGGWWERWIDAITDEVDGIVDPDP